MAPPTPTSDHPSSSSSSSQPQTQSQSQDLQPYIQELQAMLDHRWKLHLESLRASSSSSQLPFLIPEDATTTTTTPHPHQDATSNEEVPLPAFDLNWAPTEFDAGVQSTDTIPPRIRLTQLKRLARAKRVELENPDQKNKWNKLKDSCAGSAPCQSSSLPTLCGKRNRCSGKNRISDSGTGRTCHQCHQRTMNFADSCKGGSQEKPCRKAYCVQCLWIRYDEKAEAGNQLNWICPYCRQICNCGRCMKKKGSQPASIRGRRAGFRSVMERLAVNGAENTNEALNCRKASANKESVPGSDRRKDAGSSSSLEQ